MISLRGIERDLRRARLLAARSRPISSTNRPGILSGQWDGGNVVGAFREGNGTSGAASTNTTTRRETDAG